MNQNQKPKELNKKKLSVTSIELEVYNTKKFLIGLIIPN